MARKRQCCHCVLQPWVGVVVPFAEPEPRSKPRRVGVCGAVSDLVDYPSFRRCLNSREGIALRRLMSSFKRATLLIRFFELLVQPFFRAIRSTKPNRTQTLLVAQFTDWSLCLAHASARVGDHAGGKH
jgi:hypothetical protein